MPERPAVDTVVGSIQPAFWEPHDVTSLETARSDSLERAIPMEHSVRLLDKIMDEMAHHGLRRLRTFAHQLSDSWPTVSLCAEW